jgi:hypothetical protein
MVRRDHSVGHGHRATAAAALAHPLGQFFDRRLACLNVDVGYAVRGVDVDAIDMGVLA